ncbi:MAG: carotenoid biosynthesis protein [Candidatus Rokubacteria bacterium]|nr:carotenoid biosynthesis protein [Candidatus Rokubacteria bacterium]
MPAAATTMDLALGTLLLRPYVFGFLAAFVAVASRDVGWRRTLVFAAWAWPLAWLAEFSSTRVGIPFGLYHYTGSTRGQELFIANVPFMDSLSFAFLAYAAFCLARVALGGRHVPAPAVAVLAGALMMLLDVVIDPLAVRGDRWFLGRIFYYPDGGVYFGVPLSNFAGWWVVGTLAVGGYLALDLMGGLSMPPTLVRRGLTPPSYSPGPALGAPRRSRGAPRPPDSFTSSAARDRYGRQPAGGVALYYAVAAFNLVVTMWIGEWLLAAVGLALHGVLAIGLRHVNHTAELRLALGGRGVQRA